MKRRNMVVAAALIGVLALGAMAAAGRLGGHKKDGLKAVAVARGSLVDKALAVGTIEPRVEVSVKSILAGVVRKRFAAVGDFVKRGQPLLEISPNPTPLEMVELRRNVELREIELKNLERELARQQELRNRNLLSSSDLEVAQQRVDESGDHLSPGQRAVHSRAAHHPPQRLELRDRPRAYRQDRGAPDPDRPLRRHQHRGAGGLAADRLDRRAAAARDHLTCGASSSPTCG